MVQTSADLSEEGKRRKRRRALARRLERPLIALFSRREEKRSFDWSEFRECLAKARDEQQVKAKAEIYR